MATVLQAIYPSIKGGTFRVNINDGSPGGTATQIELAAGGARVRYNGDGKNRLNPIVGSSCDIDVVVTALTDSVIQTFANNLISSAEGRYTVSVEYNGGTGYSLYWCGYVLPDLSGFEDLADAYTFKITATDGLARLKGIDYAVGSFPTATPYGNVPVLEHVLNCLKKDGLSAIYFPSGIFLRTVVNWVDSTIGAPAAGKDPLALTRVSGEVFSKRTGADAGDVWEFKSCYEVLEIICRHWCARLIFSGGSYRFEQINERSLDNYPERRYSAAGSLISSVINAQSDKLINNSAIGHKISTVVFNYLPAIKRTLVRYDHRTNKNYLEGLGYKWFKTSGNNNPTSLSNIEFDSTTYFRISGRVYFNLSISGYTDPWRYIFRADIVLDTGHRLRSFTDPGVDGSGNPINIIIREPQAWEISSVYYEISTDFFYGTTATTFLDFSIVTPVLPSGVQSLTIDFDTLAGEKNTGNNQGVTVNDWRFSDLVFIMLKTDDANNYESNRYYTVSNTNTGNSEAVDFNSLFGHAVKPWTPVKLQTSANGSAWTDTTATWRQGTDATNFEFGNLIAAEILSGQDKPLRLLDGRIAGSNIFPHSRIVTTDNIGYLLMQAEFETQTGVATGTWYAAGVNRGHNSGPIVRVPDPTTYPTTAPGGGGSSGQFQTESNVKGTPGGLAELGLATQATNYLSGAVTSGVVTSIPLKFGVKANAYLAGDDIFLVNPQNGRIEGFTVSATANAGDTSLSVTSKTIDYDFPKDAYVLYSVLNKYTGEGGDGMNLPDGLLGQILRHNGDEWAPYSGTTDGHVLTWDAVNGWQAEPIPSASGGTVTSVGLAMPSLFSVTGSPVTSSGTLTAALVTQLANLVFAGPTSGGGDVPTFRLLVAGDIPNLDTAKLTTGTLPTARGGTGLNTIGTALQVLRVNAGGTALEYATISTGGVTSVGLAMPSLFSVSGSPVTSSGTLTAALVTQLANLVFAGPTSGGGDVPTFRLLVAGDIPNLDTAKLTTGTLPTARGGTGLNTIGAATQVLRVNPTGTALEYWTPNVGTVTSVGLTAPGIFIVTGSPVTGSGTLNLNLNTTATNYVFAGPASGGSDIPLFRSLVPADIPNLDTAKLTTGTLPTARGGTGLTGIGTALQVLRVNSGGTGLEYATISTGGIGGSISNTQVAFGTAANTIGGSSNLLWDNTNLFLRIGSIATPSANLQIAPVGTSGTKEVIRAQGSTSGLIYMLLSNQWNTSGVGNTQLQLTVGGANGGDPYIVMSVLGIMSWSLGVDNSNLDVFRIAPQSNPSTGTNGLTITNETTTKIGVNNTAPAFEIDNNTGRTRSLVMLNTNNPPTVTLGTGAGTGATFQVTGGKNGFYIFVTTGTAPSANAPILNVTYGVTGATASNPVFCAATTQAATDITKVYVSAANGTGLTFTANGTLAASTQYAWRWNVEYF